MESILHWDSALFLQLNGIHSAWWDTAMLFFTRKESWLPLYLVLIYLIIRNFKEKSWMVLVFFILGVVVSDQSCTIIKELVHRYRPGYDPAIRDVTHVVLRRGGEYGFPSSHAANTFFVTIFSWFLFRSRPAAIALLLWTLLVSYTRIYVGAHFPIDILAGWIIGLFTGWAFYRLLTWVEMKASGSRRRVKVKPLEIQQAGILVLVLATVTVTLLLTVYILHKYNFL
jgi:undecaprenyl-diphosphatase